MRDSPRQIFRHQITCRCEVLPPKDPAFITLRNVDKFFGEFQALDNVSLDIGLGQKIVICTSDPQVDPDPLRQQVETHDRGEIAIDGVTLDDGAVAKAALRNNVGMVFQQFNLFPHLSILDNLTLGPVRPAGWTCRRRVNLPNIIWR